MRSRRCSLDPENTPLFKDWSVIFTQAFIMKRNGLLSFVPLSAIHETRVGANYGRDSHVFINVYPKEGVTRIFRLKPSAFSLSVRRQEQEVRDTRKDFLPLYAPECHLLR